MINNYELLINKGIIAILDGDEKLGDPEDALFSMPYLTGHDLCNLSNTFGLHQDYGASRWTYLDNLLHFVIERGRCDELLCYMFDLKRFYQLEKLSNPTDIIKKYNEICHTAIERINSKLVFSDHELQFINGHFYLTEIGQKITVEAPHIQVIDIPYIRALPERCNNDFISGNYDSVITKAKTLIEEVMKYIIESRGEQANTKDDMGQLYNRVKTLLNMKQDQSYDGRVNSLLYGLERIVESINRMRNLSGDAHGLGSKRIQINEREARLVMNSAIAYCEYLLSVVEAK